MDSSQVHTRVLSSRGRTLRLIAGMVHCNQPWDLFPVLSSWLAAIAATGGFGIFYGSIWKMADALPLLRLLLISIPSEYLEAELGRDVGFPTYISIAWLSASFGAMAGALGSNFDRDVEIRSATYNLREHQRRMQQGNYTDESRDWG